MPTVSFDSSSTIPAVGTVHPTNEKASPMRRPVFNVAVLSLLALNLVVLHVGAQAPATPAVFENQTIDLGMVVSDIEKSVKWYKDVVGMTEKDGFDVPPEFAAKVGLTNNLPFHVHVLTLGEEKSASKLKLMQFKTAPGARVDQRFIHSTYGVRYLTIFVPNLPAAVARAAAHGSKPIAADGIVTLPEAFPQDLGLVVLRDPDGNAVELVGPK